MVHDLKAIEEKRMERGFQVRFPSSLESIDFIDEKTEAWLQIHGVQIDLFPIRLLVREALTNAVMHGHNNNPEKYITYSFSALTDRVHIRIEDEGAGFNWRDKMGANLNVLGSDGRGMAIMKIYAQDITFNEKGNVITLTIGTGGKET